MATATKEAKKEKVKVVKEDKAPKTKTSTPAKKTDVFGAREGSVPFKINAVLSTTPQSVEEISKACGESEKRVKQHLLYHSKRDDSGLVEKGNKYSLAKKPGRPAKVKASDESE